MKIQNLPAEFETARPILQTIETAGFEAYFVGGSVRDTLLGLPIHDVDIATSAYPAEIKALFHRTVDTGIEHGTVMVLDHGNGYEVTTFRTESGYQDYRRPDRVTFIRSLTEDLQRRDFTINALAMNQNGEIIDLFNGVDDLHRHLIRAVGDANVRFNEDALRMMRAVRFASKLNFTIDPATLHAIAQHSQLLAKIAVERIYTEFVKMMLGHQPQLGLQLMIQTQMIDYVPGLAKHLSAIQQLIGLKPFQLTNEDQVWGLLGTAFQLAPSQISPFLKQWKAANQTIDATKKIVAVTNAIQNHDITAALLFHTGRQLIADALRVAMALDIDCEPQAILAQYDALPIKTSRELAVNGGQLIQSTHLTPGPQLGRILKQLQSAVLTGAISNDAESLLASAKQLVIEQKG